MSDRPSIAIIGAGMAGLSAAYHLQKRGFSTTVFEKSQHVGGRTLSIEKDGYIMDLGAFTMSPAYTETVQLLEEIGAGDLLVPIQPVLAIARGAKLHNIDMSSPLTSGIGAHFLSLRAKLGLIKLLPTMIKYWSRCDFENMAQLEELDVENCKSFAMRKLGRETHDYLVDPVIRTFMFTSTERSSAVDLIWLTKIFSKPELIQVKGGMVAAARKVALRLGDVLAGSPVEGVKVEGDKVAVRVNGAVKHFDGAVIATPPERALEIAPWISGHLRVWFDKLRGVPSLTVHVGLKSRPNIPAAMVMVPSSEAEDVLCITLEHNKCTDRAPEGKGLIALHMTEKWAATQQGLEDLQVAHNALEIVSPFMGDLKDQVELVNLHRWEHVDHERYVGVYKSLQRARSEFFSGLVTFAGEYNSAGIEGAVISGKRCAEALSKKLSDAIVESCDGD